MLALLVIIVTAVALILRRGGGRVQHTETPLETLKRRYARGEITAEEFELIKRKLSED